VVAAAPAAASSQETPFYKRMFSSVGDLFSPSASQPVAETAQATPAQTTPSLAAPARAAPVKPVPQKRAQAADGFKVAAVRE
jgi:hypothetical protein